MQLLLQVLHSNVAITWSFMMQTTIIKHVRVNPLVNKSNTKLAYLQQCIQAIAIAFSMSLLDPERIEVVD